MRNGPIINGGKACAPSSFSVGGIGLPRDTLGQNVSLLEHQCQAWHWLLLGLAGTEFWWASNDFPEAGYRVARGGYRQMLGLGDLALAQQTPLLFN